MTSEVMNQSITYEAGEFSVDTEARTVRGLLLPWGETSRSNASGNAPIAFVRGAVKFPADISALNANRHHNRHDPIGRFTAVEDTEAGLVAEFAIARNPEGDQFLSDYKSGAIRKLSAEVRDIVRDSANKAIGIAAVLTGAAFVSEGAFESAGLFEIAELTEAPASAAFEGTTADLDGDTVTVLDAEGNALATYQITPAEPTAEDAPAPEDPDAAFAAAPTTKERTMANAVPTTLGGSASASAEETASGIFELITKARSPMGDSEAETMLAALADIKISGSGALPVSGVIQPAWLGEIWAEKSYQRRYMPLIKNGNITALEEKGFNLVSGAELVKPWAGNKTELPTGTATTEILSGVFAKWGFAADIAREFYDIPAGRPVIEAFVRKITDSYARVTDIWTLQQLFAAAGAQVDADEFPTGYSVALGKLIQAVDSVDDTDVDPAFVIVAPDVYTELRRTPKDLIPEYINFSFAGQSGTADGVTVVRDKHGVLGAGQVLAGGREVAHVNELGGGAPILLDALDIARGGIDKAAVGYTQYMTEYADGLVLIGDAE